MGKTTVATAGEKRQSLPQPERALVAKKAEGHQRHPLGARGEEEKEREALRLRERPLPREAGGRHADGPRCERGQRWRWRFSSQVQQLLNMLTVLVLAHQFWM